MVTINKVLEHLGRDGMKCNPLKCKWAVKKADFLDHYMMPDGIMPMQNKINTTVLKMD